MKWRFVRFDIDGVPLGVYIQLEHARTAIKTRQPGIAAIIRRRKVRLGGARTPKLARIYATYEI